MTRRLLYVTTFALLAATGLLATDGPLTSLMNLRARTDENGYLRVSGGSAGATDGPLTPMANLRGRTDENGYLRVALSGGSGSFTPDGDCSAPPITFVGDTDTGFDRIAANNGALCAGGATIADWTSARLLSAVDVQLGATNLVKWGTSSSFPAIKRSSTGLVVRLGDDSADAPLAASTMKPSAPAITAGSATGLTVNNAGEIRELVYKVTLASTAFVCNDVTCDVSIGTLPANTRVINADAAITTTFACTATCTSSTLSIIVGKGSGGAEYLASFDADAATAWFGDADAEMGTLLTRAAAIQGGTFSASSQAVVLRLTSGTGNIGDGAATNLSQGSVTVYLRTVVMP